MQKKIDITILCKVVDNFGDIGVVLRLSKALLEVQKQNSAIFPEINIRIVSDNLKSFSLLEPKINENLDVQSFHPIPDIHTYVRYLPGIHSGSP